MYGEADFKSDKANVQAKMSQIRTGRRASHTPCEVVGCGPLCPGCRHSLTPVLFWALSVFLIPSADRQQGSPGTQRGHFSQNCCEGTGSVWYKL